MKLTKNIVVSLLTTFSLLIAATCPAANCGKYKNHQIITHGGLCCAKAKSVFKSFQNGHIPAGWTCGQSVGGCGKGKQWFSFRSR